MDHTQHDERRLATAGRHAAAGARGRPIMPGHQNPFPGTRAGRMDTSEIYGKTELGVAELRERRLNLPVTLRSLLILVDGNRTVGEVLDKARALRLDERALTALERGGLIAKRFSAPSQATAPAATETVRTEDEVQRFMQAQQMMNDAISAHLGFRGYGLMLRLQKTANVRDLHDLLPDLAKALVKRIGMAPATPIVGAIERLITGQPPV